MSGKGAGLQCGQLISERSKATPAKLSIIPDLYDDWFKKKGDLLVAYFEWKLIHTRTPMTELRYTTHEGWQVCHVLIANSD